MAEKPTCQMLSILVADRVFREEPPASKVHVSGIFNEIQAANFPCLHPSMHLYIAFTDERPGTYVGKIRFVYLDEGQTELMSTEGPIIINSPLDVFELNVGFNNVFFPKAGILAIEFWLGEELVGDRKIRLIQRPKQLGGKS